MKKKDYIKIGVGIYDAILKDGLTVELMVGATADGGKWCAVVYRDSSFPSLKRFPWRLVESVACQA